MSGMRYVVTGGTGFLGRHLVTRLLARPGTEAVHVLVRPGCLDRFDRLAPSWDARVAPLVGDLTADDVAALGPIDHVVHCAPNPDATRPVIALAHQLGATLHHVSSIAVAGSHRGAFAEDDFDVAQQLPTAHPPGRVRGRAAGALDARAALPRVPARGDRG